MTRTFSVERFTGAIRHLSSRSQQLQAADHYGAVKLMAMLYGDPHRISRDANDRGVRCYHSETASGIWVRFRVEETK